MPLSEIAQRELEDIQNAKFSYLKTDLEGVLVEDVVLAGGRLETEIRSQPPYKAVSTETFVVKPKYFDSEHLPRYVDSKFLRNIEFELRYTIRQRGEVELEFWPGTTVMIMNTNIGEIKAKDLKPQNICYDGKKLLQELEAIKQIVRDLDGIDSVIIQFVKSVSFPECGGGLIIDPVKFYQRVEPKVLPEIKEDVLGIYKNASESLARQYGAEKPVTA